MGGGITRNNSHLPNENRLVWNTIELIRCLKNMYEPTPPNMTVLGSAKFKPIWHNLFFFFKTIFTVCIGFFWDIFQDICHTWSIINFILKCYFPNIYKICILEGTFLSILMADILRKKKHTIDHATTKASNFVRSKQQCSFKSNIICKT